MYVYRQNVQRDTLRYIDRKIDILLEGSFSDSLIATSSAIYHPKPPSLLWYTTAVIYPQIHEFGESKLCYKMEKDMHAKMCVYHSSQVHNAMFSK